MNKLTHHRARYILDVVGEEYLFVSNYCFSYAFYLGINAIFYIHENYFFYPPCFLLYPDISSPEVFEKENLIEKCDRLKKRSEEKKMLKRKKIKKSKKN